MDLEDAVSPEARGSPLFGGFIIPKAELGSPLQKLVADLRRHLIALIETARELRIVFEIAALPGIDQIAICAEPGCAHLSARSSLRPQSVSLNSQEIMPATLATLDSVGESAHSNSCTLQSYPSERRVLLSVC